MYNSQIPSVNSKPFTSRDTKGSDNSDGEKNQDKQVSNQDQKELKLFVIIN